MNLFRRGMSFYSTEAILDKASNSSISFGCNVLASFAVTKLLQQRWMHRMKFKIRWAFLGFRVGLDCERVLVWHGLGFQVGLDCERGLVWHGQFLINISRPLRFLDLGVGETDEEDETCWNGLMHYRYIPRWERKKREREDVGCLSRERDWVARWIVLIVRSFV